MATKQHYEFDRYMSSLVPVDAKMFEMEQRWGVGRLERCVSSKTLASYRRGWLQYRQAIENMSHGDIEILAPRMIRALEIMDREAEAAGHQPLSVDQWETPLPDGSVLIIVRTLAEAHAIARDKTDQRQRVIYCMAEVARVIAQMDAINVAKVAFPGAVVVPFKRPGASDGADNQESSTGPLRAGNEVVETGVVLTEGEAHDWVTGDPLAEVIA